MDNKVFLAIQKILVEPEHIGSIKKAGVEIYFTYRRHFFSVAFTQARTSSSFFIYPHWKGSLDELVEEMSSPDVSEDQYLRYNGETQEERGAIQKLYAYLNNKYTNVDSILDDILNPPPENPPPDDKIPF